MFMFFVFIYEKLTFQIKALNLRAVIKTPYIFNHNNYVHSIFKPKLHISHRKYPSITLLRACLRVNSLLCLGRVLRCQKAARYKLFCWEDQGTKLMVFDQLSWAADHRDTEAREGEASLFEVRALDRLNQGFESGSFSFSHVPA